MVRKINIMLGILCICGAIFIGSIMAYSHFSDISKSKVIMRLEERL